MTRSALFEAQLCGMNARDGERIEHRQTDIGAAQLSAGGRGFRRHARKRTSTQRCGRRGRCARRGLSCTLDSRFLQIGPDGSVAEGRFLLARPGRLRLEYDAPNPNLLVSDGRAFVHIDKSLRTIAYLPIDSTPAGLLVRADIQLSGDVTVVGIERSPAALRMSLIQTKDPRAGRLVLTFADRPLGLVGWSVVDAQGLATRLTLVDAKFGAALDATAFAFVDPNIPTGGLRP
jgi:outer membrane lipoprotein-sorting protein